MLTYQLFWILPAFVSGYFCDKAMVQVLPKVKRFHSMWLAVFYSILLVFTLHDSLKIMKGIIFAQLLIIAAYNDGTTHLIPAKIWFAIILDGFILWNPILSAIGFFIISFPAYLLAMIKKYLIGFIVKLPVFLRFNMKRSKQSDDSIVMEYGICGADIKLFASCGFVLGPVKMVNAAIIGTLIYLLYVIGQKIKYKQTQYSYAMAPFYAAGCCLAYLMKG